MKLSIGEKLKQLRGARGITQEMLSEVLGVSCQSVSRWELGICYPDMELLPVLANYFGITVDELLGMEHIRSEARRKEIFTAALGFERQGEWDNAAAVLREALKTYPQDDGMMTELALVLSKTGRTEDRGEAICLSEAVLNRSTNEKVRSTARANLCFLYKAAGLAERAAAVGRTLPHIWECREVLLPGLVPPQEKEAAVLRSMNIARQVLRDMADGEEILFSLGYKPEDDVDAEAFLTYLQT